MKNRIWPIVFSLVLLASCRSSRFMQDDMYFSTVDAQREVHQFEVAQLEKQNALKTEQPVELNEPIQTASIETDNYYDYSYTARIRRFNDPNNSWAYYDPYYTNYYWYNSSNLRYFGNSVYSTYSWWGPNFGNNYSNEYWKDKRYTDPKSKKNWTNPWVNSLTANRGTNPNTPYFYNGWNSPANNNSVSWNNYFCYNNMYYNSLDNNCYWGWWKKGKDPAAKEDANLSALMQRNGISKDVIVRPDINYTAIRESYRKATTKDHELPDSSAVTANTADLNQSTNNTHTVNKGGGVSLNTNSTKNTNTSNTSKRWDNYNADVNIVPTTKTDNNWSRSGVFSEGSRNNNYKFNGSAIPKNKNSTQVKGSSVNKDKDRK